MYRVKNETLYLDAGLVRNSGLSFGARGLLIYLLARPSGAFYLNELEDDLKSENAESLDHLVEFMVEIAQAGFAHFDNGELIVTEFANASKSPDDIAGLVRAMKHERRPEPKISLAERFRSHQV